MNLIFDIEAKFIQLSENSVESDFIVSRGEVVIDLDLSTNPVLAAVFASIPKKEIAKLYLQREFLGKSHLGLKRVDDIVVLTLVEKKVPTGELTAA